MPHQPTPPNGPKPKKPKKGWTPSKLIALCLACAIVGGGVSGGAVALASRSQKASTASGTSTVLESDRTATTNVQTQKVQAGDAMSVADIYNTYSNSVVCIQVSTSNGTGAGTGFVITEDGYIVTCYHVIDGATDIAVTFPDSTSYAATLVGGDADNDVAVLKIDASGLTPVVLGDSAQLEVGDTVTAIGNALGTLANTTTTGVVSALDRAITMSDGSVINVLQTDCTINSRQLRRPAVQPVRRGHRYRQRQVFLQRLQLRHRHHRGHRLRHPLCGCVRQDRRSDAVRLRHRQALSGHHRFHRLCAGCTAL